MPLHQVNRSLQAEAALDAALDHDRLLAAARIPAGGVVQAEAELEELRSPIRLQRRLLLQPAAQVGANGLELRVPDLRNGRREIRFEMPRHLLQDRIEAEERGGEGIGFDGQRLALRQIAKQLELYGVVDFAAGGRVHA